MVFRNRLKFLLVGRGWFREQSGHEPMCVWVCFCVPWLCISSSQSTYIIAVSSPCALLTSGSEPWHWETRPSVARGTRKSQSELVIAGSLQYKLQCRSTNFISSTPLFLVNRCSTKLAVIFFPNPKDARRLPRRGVSEAASTSRAIWAGRVTGAFRQPMSNFNAQGRRVVVLFPDFNFLNNRRLVYLFHEACLVPKTFPTVFVTSNL